MVSAGPGHYWKTIKSGKFCKHVNSMLATIIDKDVNQLKTKYKAAFKPAKKATKAKTGVADTFLPKVAKYAFMKHVCVEGEKGSGKTYSIDKYVKENGWNTEFIGGHEGIETIDLLGHLVKHTEEVAGSDFKGAKGNVFTTVSVTQYVDRMVWKDGPLTAAFRSASAGKETVLFIDEILRIPSRELNILVAALTPNSSKQYVLRTGHITGLENGVAKEETLVADCNKLWIVATTNVGADYQVDTIDEALVDRFRFIRKDNDRNEIKSILEEQAKAKKYGASVVGQLMSFYDTYSNLRTMGQVNKLLNLRHLSEAIEFGSTVDEVEENLVDLIPSLVDRTPEGYLEQEQVKLIEAAIKKAFM
jgi:MoxR-like ATPase